nr:sialate O-acetylesterase [Rufibacter quisquiliarum]
MKFSTQFRHLNVAPAFQWVALVSSIFVVTFSAQAEVTLPSLVGNGMVLQRDQPITVWGWAEAKEKVALTFNGKTFATQAGADQKWQVKLPSTPAGGPYTMVVKGRNTITLQDILVGDVWVCSGQSNMQFQMKTVQDRYRQEIASSANPQIRHFLVKHALAYSPARDVESAGWQEANPETVLGFTAVGYFFARELFEKYKVPIGLLHTSNGGTPAEAWMSADALQEFPEYQALIPKSAPAGPLKENGEKKKPSVLYNGMVAPLLPYTIKGVIWYQGEANANAGKGKEYAQLFPALIKDWRSHWGQKDFPFLFVQLANYALPKAKPGDDSWALLREAQSQTLSLPNTGMAVTHDIGEANDIHPRNKKEVGHRLALLAQTLVYGNTEVVASGPTLKAVKQDGKKMVLSFEHTGSGLVAKGGGELNQFMVAGASGTFVAATAHIKGDQVEVWSDRVPQPVAVRYAWANNPEGANLYNREGLPASSFRTDR